MSRSNMSDKIKVAIKVRALIDRETNEDLSSQWKVKDNTIFQVDVDEKQKGDLYTFDHVFDENVRNDTIFNIIARPIVESAVGGFNGTIFAYGQTSSGKTYTMMGNKREPGIIPLSIQYIFEALSNIPDREFLLRASYIEIYNEKINDLLERGKTSLKLREGPDGNIMICDLKEEVVNTADKILKLMTRGEKIRHIGETNMNERSSRSHTIFRIIIESRIPNEGEGGIVQVSHLNLVDLAGSERVDQTGVRGERLKEGCAINRSLFMLSHVISQLSEGQDQHVNFRDSKLTRILQSSLGGNTLTAIICAVTPAAIDETSSTLGFASRATYVKNKAHVNEVVSDTALLKRYARQIAKLQDELKKAKIKKSSVEVEEMESRLQEQVKHNEFLQQRIDLLKEKLIGSAADTATLEMKRALRRRTWCGHVSRKSLFPVPTLNVIDELDIQNTEDNLSKTLLFSKTIEDLTNNSLYETPLEEFELQLINSENRLSQESIDYLDQEIPSTVTCRKTKHVTFQEPSMPCTLIGDIISEPVNVAVQTEVSLTKSLLEKTINDTAVATPPDVLRHRIMYYQKEYDELREFTALEKQIYNEDTKENLVQLESENMDLRRSLKDAEYVILDMNLANSKLLDENRLLKEKLNSEFENCTALRSSQLSFQDMEKSLTEKCSEIVELKKQLKYASQKVKNLENEKSDFDTILKLAEDKHKRRNQELTQSLEDAWQKLQKLELDREANSVAQSNEEMLKLKHNCTKFQEELKEKDTLLGILKQKVEELSTINEGEGKLKEKLEKSRNNCEKIVAELGEKNSLLETLQKKVEDLANGRESDLNNINESEELQKLRNSCEKFVTELKEKDSLLGILKQKVEKSDCDLEKLRNNCSKFSGELKENYILIETLKYKVEENERESDLKKIIENEELVKLRSCCEKFVAELEEKDNLLESLKQKLENSDDELKKLRNNCSKFSGELKENYILIETLKYKVEENERESDLKKINENEELVKLRSDCEQFVAELEEKDNLLESLKQKLENSDNELKKLRNNCSKFSGELKENHILIETLKYKVEENERESDLKKVNENEELVKLRSCCEQFVTELEEKDNLLESLKGKLENSDDELEKLRNNCSKFSGELKENHILIETLKYKVEENERESDLKKVNENEELVKLRSCCEKFVTELEEKDNLLESLKGKLENSDDELEKLRNNCSKFSGELKENYILIENLKYKVEENERERDLKKINENEELLKLRSCCEKFVEELKEKDNLLESVKENSDDELEKLRNNCSKLYGELEKDYILIETLKQKIEENDLKNIRESDELEKLRIHCEEFVAQLKKKDSLLETLKQEVEDFANESESDLKKISENELEKLRSCCEKFVAELKEKDNLLKSLKQKLENSDDELEKLRNNCSKFCGELEENDILIETLKQKVEENDLKNINENGELEKLRSDCEKFVAELKEKDSLLETLKEKVEDLANEKENDLKKINENEELEKLICCEKFVAELKEKDSLLESLKQELENSVDELEKLRSNCSEFCGELEKNHVLIEALKQKVEENDLKNIKENEELEKLRSDCEKFVAELKEKDTLLETLKQKVEDLGNERESDPKKINENEELEKLICCEKFVAELKEKDNLLESLKQELENSDDELEKLRSNCSEFCGELEKSHVLIEALKQKVEENDLKNIKENEELEKLRSDCEKFVAKLKEKDSLLEILKQKVEDLGNERESDLKKINENGELEKLSCCEKFVAELKEKDNLLESLKQKLENSDDELEKLRSNCSKFCVELEENHILIEALKQKVEENAKQGDLKNIKETEEFECLKQKIVELGGLNEGESSLNYLEEFKERFKLLRQDYDFICKEMIEKDKCLAELKFQVKSKEDYCEEIENMKNNNTKLKEENNSLYKELKDRDNHIQMLKLQVEQLISERKAIDKEFNEAKENNKLIVLDTGLEEFGVNEKLNNLQIVERNYETLKLQYDIICKELKGKDSIIENLKMKIEHLKYENSTEINCEQWKSEMVNSVSETVTNMEELGCFKEFEEGKYVNYKGAHWRGSGCEVLEQNIISNSESEAKENVKQLNEDYNAITEELMKKDKELELLKQQIEQLTSGKECHFKVLHQFEGESNYVNKQINEDYNVITNELMEKNKELQLLRKQILQLTSEKEDNLKLLHQLESENELMKEQITVSGFECKIDCEALQDKSNERLMEKYNLFSILGFEMKQMYSKTEINLKQIKDIKDYIEQLNIEMSEKFVVNARQVKLFIHQIEQLDSEKEAGLKIIKKLKEDNELINKQMQLSDDDKDPKNKILEELKIKYDHLKIENDLNKRELEEKDKYLYLLKRQMEQLISQRESVRKDIRPTSDYNTFDFSLMNVGKQEEILGLHVEDDDKMIEQVTDLGKEDYPKSLEDVKEICEISTHENRCHMKEMKEKNKQLDNLQIDQAVSEKEMYIKEIERLEYRYDHLNQDYGMMKEKLDTANGQIDIFKLQIESLESAKDLHLNCLDEMKRNYERLKQENDSHTEALRKVNTYIEKLIKKLEELCSDCDDLLNQEVEVNCQELKMNKDNKLQFLESLVTWLIRKKHSLKVDYDTLLQSNREISNQLKDKEELVDKLLQKIHNLFHLSKSHSLSFVESDETCAFTEMLESTIEDSNSNTVENKQGNLGKTMVTLRSNSGMYTEKLQEEPVVVCVERLTQEVECLKNNTSSEQMNVIPDSIRHLKVQNVDTELFKHTEQLLPTEKSHVTENCRQVMDVQLTNDACTIWEHINALENIHREGGGKEKGNETILYCKKDQTEYTDVKILSSTLFPDLLGTELISRLEAEISALREKNENGYTLLKENYDETCDMVKAKTEVINKMKADLSDFNRKLKEEIEKNNLLNEFLEEKSTEYDNLLHQSETQRNQLVTGTELEAMTELLSDKTEEIDFCRKALVREITSLNSNWDVKLLHDFRLSELLKNLLSQIMEKENELVTHLQHQMEEICTQNAENIRMYEDKARRKDTWVKELEGEIERLQADLVRAEEESKSLRLNESIKVLKDEKLEILNKLRQIETEATLNQIKMKSLISDNKIMTEKLNDVQLLVAQRDARIAQLSEELKKQNVNILNIDEQTELNEKYKQTLKYMADEMKGLRNSNYKLMKELENKEEKIKAKDSTVSHNQEKLGEMNIQLKIMEEEIINLKCKNAELIHALESKIDEISQLHEELYQKSVITKKCEQLEEEVENKREEINAKDAIISHNHNELGEMNVQLKTLEDKFTMLEIKNVELSNALQNKIEEILQKDMKVSQLCDELKNHKSLTNKYEQLGKEFVTLKVKNTELAHTLESTINEVSQKDVRISQLQKELHYSYVTNTEYEQLVKELENRSEEVKAKDTTISHNRKQLREMSMQLKTFEGDIINLKCKNLELADRLKNKIDEILYRDIKIAELNEQLNHKSVISIKYEELEEEVKNKREEIKAKDATIFHNHEEIEQLKTIEREFTTLKINNAELTNTLEDKIEVILQKDAKILQLHEELKNHKSIMNEKYKQLKQAFSNLKIKNEELVVSQLHEESKSKQHSVATLTDVTDCQCSELVEKLQQAKRTIVELNTKIGTLELQIKTEELPYQQSVKQLEANLHFYKKKNTMLKSELRHLQHQVNEAQKVCETCVRRNSKVMKEVLIQTDNLQDDGGSKYYDFGGSGIVREHTILELKLAIKEKNTEIALLKDLCRKRRKKILTLEEELLKVTATAAAAGKNSIRNSQHLIDAIVQTDDFTVCSLKSRFKEDNMEMQKMIVKIGDLQKENEQLRNLYGSIRKKPIEQENVHLWYPPSTLTSADQCSMPQESQRVKKLYSSGVTPGFHTSSDRHLHSSNKENISHSYKTIETHRTLK